MARRDRRDWELDHPGRTRRGGKHLSGNERNYEGVTFGDRTYSHGYTDQDVSHGYSGQGVYPFDESGARRQLHVGMGHRGAGYRVGHYSGIGPKGYRRSDERIKDDACEGLRQDGEVDASDIEVEVEGGVITLNGTVGDRAMKRAAEDVVYGVSGVDDVLNHLRVQHRGQTVQAETAEQAKRKNRDRSEAV